MMWSRLLQTAGHKLLRYPRACLNLILPKKIIWYKISSFILFVQNQFACHGLAAADRGTMPWIGDRQIINHSVCAVQCCTIIANSQVKQYKRQGLFSILVLEVSVHGLRTPLSFGLWWGRASQQKELVEDSFTSQCPTGRSREELLHWWSCLFHIGCNRQKVRLTCRAELFLWFLRS